ncbi:MAG: septum formation initiator family protein [Clostridia bacterium]|nr:septum formation initiator family protein [Clostridia bacterium]
MNKRKVLRIRPFRIAAIGLGMLTLFLLAQFPQKMVSIENQQKQLSLASEKYFAEQSRHNQLNDELETISTPDFIERTARRDQNYCWYGEVVYKVSNLSELMTPEEFAVYGQE